MSLGSADADAIGAASFEGNDEAMSLAAASIIGTMAAEENCLFARVSDTGILNESGKPISSVRLHGYL